MGQTKRLISKEQIEEQLRLNPDVTKDQLKAIFRCGSHTITRELTRHGLRTKLRQERPITAEHRAKLSEAASKKCGALNPNYGAKPRPWLEGDRHPLRKWHKEHPEFGEEQKGAANPIHKVRHLYDDPAYVRKITRGIVSHVNERRGRSYEETYGEEKASEYREKLRAASPIRLAKFTRKSTGPERTMRSLLTDLGVDFHEQYPVGYCTVDFFVPAANLIIQTDGDYWHGHPKRYPEPDARQRERRRLDAAADAYARNRGMGVLRFWESDLKDVQACRARLRQEIDKDE